MANRFGTAAISGDPQVAVTPQEHVNLELFKALELLGRKLERVEGERDQLARRLAAIESSATVDARTGKLYLPIVVDPRQAAPKAAPLWTVPVALGSSALALCALGLVLFGQPAPLELTPRQIAALEALTDAPRFADAATDEEWAPVEGASIADAGDHPPVAGDPPAADVSPAHTASAQTAEAEVRMAAAPAVPAVPEAVSAKAPVPPVKLPTVEVSQGWQVDETPPSNTAAAAPTTAPAAPAATAPTAASTDIPAAPRQEKKEVAKAAEPVVPVADIDPDASLPAKLVELEQRAFRGEAEARHDLATIYASGKLVAQDYKRAAYWFAKAAEGGIANAHYNLGVMFQQGLGVRKDVNRALGWYEKAAQLGHPEAMYNLGIAYVEGVGTERNIERGIASFKKAANAGVAQAAYNLGVLYESNYAGPINLPKAAEWYAVAAESGHADSVAAVRRLRQQIADAARTGDQGSQLANSVEPAAGADDADDAEFGEGDSSPRDSGTKE